MTFPDGSKWEGEFKNGKRYDLSTLDGCLIEPRLEVKFEQYLNQIERRDVLFIHDVSNGG